eukprot:GHRR01021310.1.p1 GENE.GHRR01021310.1~~GHRR01021310.1.p1  ORF type:complete len:496 (+),score=235.55 GHRR01021310.1:1806-3293(+)
MHHGGESDEEEVDSSWAARNHQDNQDCNGVPAATHNLAKMALKDSPQRPSSPKFKKGQQPNQQPKKVRPWPAGLPADWPSSAGSSDNSDKGATGQPKIDHQVSLAGLLAALNIKGGRLHNAGNDAGYTMEAFLALAGHPTCPDPAAVHLDNQVQDASYQQQLKASIRAAAEQGWGVLTDLAPLATPSIGSPAAPAACSNSRISNNRVSNRYETLAPANSSNSYQAPAVNSGSTGVRTPVDPWSAEAAAQPVMPANAVPAEVAAAPWVAAPSGVAGSVNSNTKTSDSGSSGSMNGAARRAVPPVFSALPPDYAAHGNGAPPGFEARSDVPPGFGAKDDDVLPKGFERLPGGGVRLVGVAAAAPTGPAWGGVGLPAAAAWDGKGSWAAAAAGSSAAVGDQTSIDAAAAAGRAPACPASGGTAQAAVPAAPQAKAAAGRQGTAASPWSNGSSTDEGALGKPKQQAFQASGFGGGFGAFNSSVDEGIAAECHEPNPDGW